MAEAEWLREGSSVNSPQEAGPGGDANFPNHDVKLERLGAPTVNSLPEDVQPTNADEEPPETTPEPMTMESPTDSLVPAPDPKETGIRKGAETPQQPQAVFGIVEARR